jgi:hypothetical protein
MLSHHKAIGMTALLYYRPPGCARDSDAVEAITQEHNKRKWNEPT